MCKHVLLLAIVLALTGALLGQAAKADPAATFLQTDEKTVGNWKGVYGAEGAIIIGDAEKPPKYAKVTARNKADFTWANPTDDVRALQKSAAEAKDRVAGCWYAGETLDIDLDLTDGVEHQVAVYCVDWDGTNREIACNVESVATGDVLDRRVVADFHGGKYLVWKIKGHVNLHLINNGQSSLVVSGILFDAATQPEPATQPAP
jgi:hypothetical protein